MSESSRLRRDLADLEAACAEKRAEYDAAEARVTRLRAELAGLLQEAAALRGILHSDHSLLTQSTRGGKNKGMESTQAYHARGARLRAEHQGAKRIREVDGSIGAFAKKHRLKPTTVRSWYATGEAARDIPKTWADKLAAEPYLIPLATWRSVGP